MLMQGMEVDLVLPVQAFYLTLPVLKSCWPRVIYSYWVLARYAVPLNDSFSCFDLSTYGTVFHINSLEVAGMIFIYRLVCK